MSVESAKSFIKRIDTDGEFAKRVNACKDAQERKILIQNAGFDFTASELRAAGTVLSDDDLDSVAGGEKPIIVPDPDSFVNLTFN